MDYRIENLLLDKGWPDLMRGTLLRGANSVAQITELEAVKIEDHCARYQVDWLTANEAQLFEVYVMNYSRFDVAPGLRDDSFVALYESNIPMRNTRDYVLHRLFRYSWTSVVNQWLLNNYTLFRVSGDLPNQWRVLDMRYGQEARKSVEKYYKSLNPVFCNERSS